MRIAVIKPDHLGDLVLSAPAIRAIARRHPDCTVFVGPWNRRVASVLLPDLNIETITFSHLSKAEHARENIPDLRGFDCVAILRNDHIVNAEWADLRARDYVVAPARNDLHQSLLDYAVIHPVIGEYDIDALFYGAAHDSVMAKLDRPPERIGLSVGSGFYANLWPLERWVGLARRMMEAGHQVSIIAGPSDQDRARYIALRAGLDPAGIIAGSSDLADFLPRIAALDLVVATDGGGAHLCSMVTPVVAVFGPSPFRRYAPFGQATRLITRDLPCSPCCQYTTNLINGCLTTECMTQITTGDILAAIALPLRRHMPPRLQQLGHGVQLWWGISHIGRQEAGYLAGVA